MRRSPCPMCRNGSRDGERSGRSLTEVQVDRLQYFTGEFSGSFVEFGEKRGVVDDIPDAVADLLEADVFAA